MAGLVVVYGALPASAADWHRRHGLIEDNVAYNWTGAGFVKDGERVLLQPKHRAFEIVGNLAHVGPRQQG